MRTLTLIFIFSLITGMTDGLNQTILFHFDYFKERFPESNDRFWDPRISHNNKWINPDAKPRDKKERFPGSSTAFVWLTDAYHLTRTLFFVLIIAMLSTAVFIPRELFDHWSDLWIILLLWLVKVAGFHLVYTLYF